MFFRKARTSSTKALEVVDDEVAGAVGPALSAMDASIRQAREASQKARKVAETVARLSPLETHE